MSKKSIEHVKKLVGSGFSFLQKRNPKIVMEEVTSLKRNWFLSSMYIMFTHPIISINIIFLILFSYFLRVTQYCEEKNN